jgi:hypothetical protein
MQNPGFAGHRTGNANLINICAARMGFTGHWSAAAGYGCVAHIPLRICGRAIVIIGFIVALLLAIVVKTT